MTACPSCEQPIETVEIWNGIIRAECGCILSSAQLRARTELDVETIARAGDGDTREEVAV